MIGSLRGVVIDREGAIDRASSSEVVIDVAGVGYRVAVTIATVDRVAGGDEVLLHTHHHFNREGDQRLFGFLSKEERKAFEGLISAPGVGPSLAMAVLSTHGAAGLARILADDDLAALCEVPGVGKKTAQRLLVELRSSLVLPDLGTDAIATAGAAAGNGGGGPSPLVDVREALVNLGYSGDEIAAAMASLPVDESTGEVEGGALGGADASGRLLRLALRALAGA